MQVAAAADREPRTVLKTISPARGDVRESQAQRERQADPARRGRLAEDQARIDAVLAETGQ